MDIRIDDLRGPEIRKLLEEHRRSMFLHSPPESVHALDLDGLRVPAITFYTAWEEGVLLGCGALKALPDRCGEIKSMRTASAHLRKGVAAAMLSHIIAEARRRGYAGLYLETGTAPAFAPARSMYAKAGFVDCPPFGAYALDPYSAFMHLQLTADCMPG